MKYRLSDDVSMEEAGGVCVFLKESGDAAASNSIGGIVVKGLIADGFHSTADRISETYGMDLQIVENDIEEFVELLESRGIINGE